MKITARPLPEEKKKSSLHVNMKTSGLKPKKNKKLSQQSVDAIVKAVKSPQGLVKKIKRTEIANEKHSTTTGSKLIKKKSLSKSKKVCKPLQTSQVSESVLVSNISSNDVILTSKAVSKNVGKHNDNVLKMVKQSQLGDKIRNKLCLNSKKPKHVAIVNEAMTQDRKKALKAKNLHNVFKSTNVEDNQKNLNKENQPQKISHKSKSVGVRSGIIKPKRKNSVMANVDCTNNEKMLHQELSQTILPARRLMEIVRKLTLSTSENLNYSWAVTGSDLVDHFPTQLQVARVFLHHLQTVVYRGCLLSVECGQQHPHLVRPDVVASVGLLYTKLIRMALQDKPEFSNDLISLSGVVAAAWIDLTLIGKVDVPTEADGSEDMLALAKVVRTSVLRNLSCPDALEGGLDALLRSVYLRGRSIKSRKLARLLFGKYLQRVLSWNCVSPLANSHSMPIPVYTKLLCAIKHLHNSQLPKNVSGFLPRFLEGSSMPPSPAGLFAWSRSKNLAGSFVASKVTPALVILRTMQLDPVMEAVYNEQYGTVTEEEEVSDSIPDAVQTKSKKKKKEQTAKPTSKDSLLLLREALRGERQPSPSLGEAASTQLLQTEGADVPVPAVKKRKSSVSLEEHQNAADDDYPPKPKTRKRRLKKKLAAKKAEGSPQSDDQPKNDSSEGSSGGVEGDCEAESVVPDKKKRKNKHHKYIRSSKRNRALKKRAEKLAAAAASLRADSTVSDGTDETKPASKKVKLDQDPTSRCESKTTDSVVDVFSTRSAVKSKSFVCDNSQRLTMKRDVKIELSERSDSQTKVDVDHCIVSDHETTIDLADTPVKSSKGKSIAVPSSTATSYDSDGSDIVLVEEVQGTSAKTRLEEEQESDGNEDGDESADEEEESLEKNNKKKVKSVSLLDDEEEELHDVDETKPMFTDKEVRKCNKKVRRTLEMLRRQEIENTMKKEQEEAAKILAIKLEIEEKEKAKRNKAFALDWSNYKQVVKPRKGGLSNQCNDLLNNLYKRKSAEQLEKEEYEKQREEDRLVTYQQSVKKMKTKAKKELIKSALEGDQAQKTTKPKVLIEEGVKPLKKRSKSSRRKRKGDIQVVYSTVPISTPSEDMKPGLEDSHTEEPPKVKPNPAKKPSLSETLDQVCVTKMYKNKDYGKFLASVVSVSKAAEYQQEVGEKLSAVFGSAQAEVVEIDEVKLVDSEKVTAEENDAVETAVVATDKTEKNNVDMEDALIDEEITENEEENDTDDAVSDENKDSNKDAVSDDETQEAKEENEDYNADAVSDEETQECEFESQDDGEDAVKDKKTQECEVESKDDSEGACSDEKTTKCEKNEDDDAVAVSDKETQDCEEESDDEKNAVSDKETEEKEEGTNDDRESITDQEESDAIDGETEVVNDDETEAEFSAADEVGDDEGNAANKATKSVEVELTDEESGDGTADSDEDSQRVVTLDDAQEEEDLPNIGGESADEPDQVVSTKNTERLGDEDHCDVGSEKKCIEDLSMDQACDDLVEKDGLNSKNGKVDLKGHYEEDCELVLEEESGIDLTGGKDTSGVAEIPVMETASPIKHINLEIKSARKGQADVTSMYSTPMTKSGVLSAELFTASASSITPHSARCSPADTFKAPSPAAAAKVLTPPIEVPPMPRRLSASPNTKLFTPSAVVSPTPKGVTPSPQVSTPSPKFATPIKVATPSPKVATPSPKVATPSMVATPLKFATPTKVATPSRTAATSSSMVATPSLEVIIPSLKVLTPSSKRATPSPKVATPSPKMATPSPKMATPSPKMATPSLKMATPSPKIATPSPKIATPSLKIATPSLKIATPSPKIATPSPKMATPSSKMATPSPKVVTPYPKVTTPSPKVAASFKAVTPSTVTTPSTPPKVVTPTLKVNTPSPIIATPSPKAATPSHKNATPSSKVATPSSKVATPSSKVATPSPKVATPASKSATPSALITASVVSSTVQQEAKLSTPSKTSASSGSISSSEKATPPKLRSPAKKADQMKLDADRENIHSKKSKRSSKTSTASENILESSPSSPNSSDDLEIDTSFATSMGSSEGTALVGKSPGPDDENNGSPLAVSNAGRNGTQESSANLSISRQAKYTEQEGDELEIHSGDCSQFSPKSKLSRTGNIAELVTVPVIGPSKRKSIENLSSTPLLKKSKLSMSFSNKSSLPLRLSLSEMNERATVCSDVSIQLSRSIKTSPRLVSSAALTSEVIISPDLSDEETTAGKSDEDLFSDNEDMVIGEAFETRLNNRSPIRAACEEQEESDPIRAKKDDRNKSPAKLTTTPQSQKKSKLLVSVSKTDNSQSFNSLLQSPLLQKSPKKTPSKGNKSTDLSSASPTLKLELEEDVSAKTESPKESTTSKPEESGSKSADATDSFDPVEKQSTRRLTRRSSSVYEHSIESTTATSSISTSSCTEFFSSVTNIETIKELGSGGIATRTRRRSVSSVSNVDDDESSSSSAIGSVVLAPRTRRRSISDLDAPNTPAKKVSGGAPSSLIGTIMEEEDGEDSASVSNTKSRPPPTTVATRRRSILSTPQKSSPLKATSSLTLELLSEENTIPSSPTIGGRTRRASLSGAPVAAASPAPSTATPRRRSLAVRSSSAAKAVDSVASSPARRVSKMKRLSESPVRSKMEEEASKNTEKESSELGNEEVLDARKGEAEDEGEKNPADDKDSSPSEVGSVSGDSAGGDAPRRTLRLRRQPITYK